MSDLLEDKDIGRGIIIQTNKKLQIKEFVQCCPRMAPVWPEPD